MIIKLHKIILTTILLFTGLVANAAHLGDHLLFSARLDGDQAVPMVDTDALGVAGFKLSETRGELCVNVAVNGLSGAITAAHIHQGAVGESGDVLVNLSTGIVGNQITLTVTGADLTFAIIEQMLAGNTYLNIHTDANPDGEIRGQIGLESDWLYYADANAANAVPMTASSGEGVGIFVLSKDQTLMSYMFVVDDLDDGDDAITAAHLHLGAPGEAGGVSQNLSGDIDGNVIVGEFVPTVELLDNLKIGEIYLNVHTIAYPDGEIRGQLEKQDLGLDSRLDGDQAGTIAPGRGSASFTISNDFSEISYDIIVEGLVADAAITASHLHEAEPGEDGDVLINFSDDIDGNRISGTITGGDVTTELINALLRGDTYINIHTDLFPDGEIRGQVYRVAREGYTTLMSSGAELHDVTNAGKGGGIVSVDRNQTNAHFMFVVSDLSDAVTGAHFHNAAEGADGGVIYALNPFFSMMGPDDAAFGYWKSDDVDMPFTTTESEFFRDEEVYINVHTSENPDGEIRGQMDRDGGCYNLVSIDENEALTSLNVYPNPFNDNITIQTNDLDGEFTVEIVNVSGQVVLSQSNLMNNQNIMINTNAIQEGIYFIVVKNAEGVVATEKITKL